MEQVLLKDGRTLTIRRAEESDAERIVAYSNEVGGESDFLTFGKDEFRYDTEQEKEFIRGFQGQRGSIFLTAWVGEEIVSTANICAEQKLRVAHNGELGISVRKQFWHLGVASAMLSALIAFAKESNLEIIHLGVYGRNERAIRLYQKFGFETVGCNKNYFKNGSTYDDAVQMDLFL